MYSNSITTGDWEDFVAGLVATRAHYRTIAKLKPWLAAIRWRYAPCHRRASPEVFSVLPVSPSSFWQVIPPVGPEVLGRQQLYL